MCAYVTSFFIYKITVNILNCLENYLILVKPCVCSFLHRNGSPWRALYWWQDYFYNNLFLYNVQYFPVHSIELNRISQLKSVAKVKGIHIILDMTHSRFS